MKERWLVTLYVEFITLHKSNIQHYERKHSLMFQKLYSESLKSKEASRKTCYWKCLEWFSLYHSNLKNTNFLWIRTTVLFNTHVWHKTFFCNNWFFDPKSSRKNKLTEKYAWFLRGWKKRNFLRNISIIL